MDMETALSTKLFGNIFINESLVALNDEPLNSSRLCFNVGKELNYVPYKHRFLSNVNRSPLYTLLICLKVKFHKCFRLGINA